MSTPIQRLARTAEPSFVSTVSTRAVNLDFAAFEYAPVEIPSIADVVAIDPRPPARAAGEACSLSAIESRSPHLLDKIIGAWRSRELHEFLSRVTMMDRPDRQGFPPEVASELFTLFLLNRELAHIEDSTDKFR